MRAYPLVAVKPGIVLISLTSARSPSRKKSTRAMPEQSMARKAASASSWMRRVSSGAMGAGTVSRACPSAYFVA